MRNVKTELTADSPRQLLLGRIQFLSERHEIMNKVYCEVAQIDLQTTLHDPQKPKNEFFNIDKLAALDNETLLKEIRKLEKDCLELNTACEGILSQRTSY